jgi:hypothetical protein
VRTKGASSGTPSYLCQFLLKLRVLGLKLNLKLIGNCLSFQNIEKTGQNRLKTETGPKTGLDWKRPVYVGLVRSFEVPEYQ